MGGRQRATVVVPTLRLGHREKGFLAGPYTGETWALVVAEKQVRERALASACLLISSRRSRGVN